MLFFGKSFYLRSRVDYGCNYYIPLLIIFHEDTYYLINHTHEVGGSSAARSAPTKATFSSVAFVLH